MTENRTATSRTLLEPPRALAIALSSVLLASASLAFAEDDVEPGKAVDGDVSELVAYRAARIVVTPDREVAPGWLVVRGARVESVTADEASIPEGATRVELGDVVVLPGLVNPISAISESSYRRSQAGRATYSGRTPSDARAAVALARVDVDDDVYRRLGRSGYTTIALLPSDSGALVAGRASVIRPRRGDETSAKDLTLVETSYLFLGFETGKAWHDAAVKAIRGAAEKIIAERKAAEEAKKKAEEEAKKKAEEAKKAEAEGKKPQGESGDAKPDEKKEGEKQAQQKKPEPPDPLVELFEGRVQAFVRIRSPAAIDHFFAFYDALPLSFRFVLVTGPQPPEIVKRIIERRSRIDGVILEPSLGSAWETSVLVNSARLFRKRGIDVAFVPQNDDLDGFRSVFFDLAHMVRTGVWEDDALAAVTTTPARLLGLEGKVGCLEKDAFASFAVYDRDPLAGNARLLRVYVEGREVFGDDIESGELRGEAVR